VKRFQPRVARTARGDYRLRIPPAERRILRSLPGQLRALLATDDPALERLFPPAYADDPEAEDEFAELTHGELREGKLSALQVMEATLDARRVDEEQMLAWLGALNDLRLVLGTRLDVTEEMYEAPLPEDDPRAAEYTLYHYLGWLQEQVVAALAE
jgi:Domain of unknown function (DUF2017)